MWTHGHTRLSYPPLSPGVHPNSCPLSQWCYLTNCCPFSFYLQSFLASGSFAMSWLSSSVGQSIGASPSASVLPLNIQGWFPLIDLFDLLAVQGTLKSLLQHHSSKTSIVLHSAFFMVQLSQSYMTTGKIIALDIHTFVSKVISLLFNMVSRFVIVFLSRSKYLLISWLRSLSIVIWEHRKIKFVTVPTFYPCFGHEVMGMDAMISVFLICLS